MLRCCVLRGMGVIGLFSAHFQRIFSSDTVAAANQLSSPTETYAVCRMTRSYVNFLEGQIRRLSFLYAFTDPWMA